MQDTPVLSARSRLIEPIGWRARRLLSNVTNVATTTVLRTVDVMITHSCELAASSMSIRTASTINHQSTTRWPCFRRPPTRRGLRPRPDGEQLVAQGACYGDARFQDPFPNRELTRPSA